MNKKLKRKQALIMAEPYRTPFNSKVAKVNGDVIEDSVGGIKYATSFDGATKIVDGNKNKIKIKDGVYSFGKSVNVLNLPDIEETTVDGITYSIKDGVITINGTNSTTSTVWIWIDFVSSLNGTYSFNSFAPTTTYVTGTRISLYDNTTEKPIAQLFNNEYSSTIELANYECKKIGIACGAGQTFTNATIKPMLVSGSTIPTNYYSGSYGIKIEVADGVMTCNGMLASDSEQNWWYNFELPISSGIYSANIFLRSRNINVYLSQDLTDWDHSYQIAVKEAQTAPLSNINIKTDCKYMFFSFDREHDYDNLILKPMLVLGTTAPTEFEPYFKNLLIFDDLEETTTNGITYSIKNGVLKFKGSSAAPLNLFLKLKNRISKNTIVTSNLFGDKWTYSNNIYLAEAAYSYDKRTTFYTRNNLPITFTAEYDYEYFLIQLNDQNVDLTLKPILVKGDIAPSKFIPFANPYFVSLGQNGSVQYNGLEPREIDLKGNVISKINNQASDKLSNYSLTKNTKVVDLGSLTWETKMTDTDGVFRMVTSDIKQDVVLPINTSTNANILCTKYKTISGDLLWRRGKGIAIGTPSGDVSIYDPEYNTSDKLEAFKKAIRGTLLMYQVKNPTTINTTSFKTFKEDTNATISDDNFTISSNPITETFKPTRSYDFKVNGFSNVVKSSNLLNIPDKANTTTNGITYSIKDGVITLNGTSTETTFIPLISGLNGRYYSINCFNNASNDDLQIMYGVNGVVWNAVGLGTANASRSIDFLEEQTNIFFTIRINQNTSLTNATIKPMLVSGSTIPTTYEPYFDPYIESFADKKNLLNLPIKSGTINNVSYNISQGNVLTLNGTMSTASNYVMVNDLNLVLEKGIYTFAITKNMLINNVSCAIILGTTDGDLIFTIQGRNTSITTILPSKTTINYLRMWINPTTFHNYQIRLMLIQGKTAPTTFLPYQNKYSAFLNVKGRNLLEFENQSGTIPAGISYNVKNQIITLNGTAKDDGWVWFPFEATLNGTYSFKVITSKPISSSTTNKARISLDNPRIAGQVLVYLHQSLETTVELNNFTCKNIGINSPINETWDDMQFLLILVEGDKIPEYEPYYSFTKEVLIKQPLRKFDYLTYDGVYRQTNEITLDGSWNVVRNNYLFKNGMFICSIQNFFPKINNWNLPYSKLYGISTSDDLPMISAREAYTEGNSKKGIAFNDGEMIIHLDDSTDNSLNNWTVEKINNYFKQNPITITYKTVDQTFEATSLTRLLFKNGYNKITAFDSINNNAIVEYLEYYKSKGD